MTKLFRPAHTALLMTCLFGGALAQAGELVVQSLAVSGKDTQGEPYGKSYSAGKIVMPFVKAAAPADEVAARRINELLFITLTGVLPPRQPGTGFVVNGSEELTGTAEQAFTVPRNDGRILGIDVEAEGCGAYCESYTRQFSFEATTGRLLTPQNLFTLAGQRALAARVTAERVRQYREQLRSLRAELKQQQASQRNKKAGKPAAVELDEVEERIALNEDCLAGLTGKSRQGSAGDTPPEQTLVTYQQAAHPKSYDITAGRCSNHAMRALDDVGDVTLSLPYADLAPYLTPYGKGVLLGDASAPAEPADPFTGQVLHGLLTPVGGNGNTANSGSGSSKVTPVSNAIPITLLVSKPYGQLSGKYFYDRVGKPIELSGTGNASKMELTEQTGDKAGPGAVFKLARSGNALKGQWAGQKTFNVQLAP